MSIPPNSRAASRNAPRTLFSSVMSQRNANARTPRPARSTTVCCASRAELRKVIATSAPDSASASALARPNRFAPPVINAVLPRSGWFISAFPRDVLVFAMTLIVPSGTCRSGRSGLAPRPKSKPLPFRTRSRVAPKLLHSAHMSETRQVLLYTRKGCHLCEIVKESLVKLQRRGGFLWREIDVDSDEQLRREYNDQVPVVFIDGRKAFKYHMDEREFLRRLAS